MITLRKLLYCLLAGLIFSLYHGCSAEKDAAERRNLMMPKISEQPRNSSHYKEGAKKKTYKSGTKKKNKTKKLF
jgi:hypothetical protein